MHTAMRKLYYPNLGLFAIRLSLAMVFLVAGIMKLANMEMTIGFFATAGIGAFWAWAVALVETAGGLFMLLGVFTTYAGIALSIIMVVASVLMFPTAGFMGIQMNIVLFLISIGITLSGSGKLALSRYVPGCNCKCSSCVDAKCDCTASESCGCNCGTCASK